MPQQAHRVANRRVHTGYLFTYYNSKVGKEREAQIDRVNEQVKDLYGPLLSCVTASKSAFDAMIRQHSPDGTKAGFVRAIRENPESGEAIAYRYRSQIASLPDALHLQMILTWSQDGSQCLCLQHLRPSHLHSCQYLPPCDYVFFSSCSIDAGTLCPPVCDAVSNVQPSAAHPQRSTLVRIHI